MRITEQELKKLKRTELCDLLLEQVKVIEDLQEKVDIQEEKLAERKVHIDKAGTIAEACFHMNGVLEAAEKAAQQYLENIEMLNTRQEEICAQKEEEINAKVAQMIADTEHACEEKTRVIEENCLAKEKEADAYFIAQTKEADDYFATKKQEADAYAESKIKEADDYWAVKTNETDVYCEDKTRKTEEACAVKTNEVENYCERVKTETEEACENKTKETEENCASLQEITDKRCVNQLDEMEAKCAEMLNTTTQKCADMEAATEQRIEQRWAELTNKLEAFIDAHEGLRGLLASAGIQSNML